jgi:hypothetical protein
VIRYFREIASLFALRSIKLSVVVATCDEINPIPKGALCGPGIRLLKGGEYRRVDSVASVKLFCPTHALARMVGAHWAVRQSAIGPFLQSLFRLVL